MFGNFSINYIHAPLAVCGGLLWGVADLTTYLTNKMSFIQIPHTADNLCCAKAIVTAKACINNLPIWEAIRHSCNIQTHLAQQPHQQAQVPDSQMCSKEEWAKYQHVLGTEYQLFVYFRDYFNTNIYSGPQFAEKQTYLYHAASHFSVVTSMPSFLDRAYFCKCCKVGYQDAGTHIC